MDQPKVETFPILQEIMVETERAQKSRQVLEAQQAQAEPERRDCLKYTDIQALGLEGRAAVAILCMAAMTTRNFMATTSAKQDPPAFA